MRMNRRERAAGTLLILLAMSLWMPRAQAIPPDPDNAALLYYQAFLSLPDLDDQARTLLGDVARGKVDPNDKVRQYVQSCRAAIETAEAAAKLQKCDWGFRFSQGFDALMPQLAQVRFLTFVLIADARVRAADGDYRGAFERCLMTDTLARHVGDDTLVSYLVSIAVRNLGYQCIVNLAGRAGVDAPLLQWLKKELATTSDAQLTPVRPLKIEMEIVLDTMHMDRIEKLARAASGDDEQMRAKIIAGANEEVLAKGRRLYSERVTVALKVLGASLPYEQGYMRLEQIDHDFDPNDPGPAAAGMFLPALNRIYTLKTRSQAQANATRAGVEICLQKAQSGTLPTVLPNGLPQDPFSGQDFEYKRTDDGFVLRCRAEELGSGGKVDEYVFTVK